MARVIVRCPECGKTSPVLHNPSAPAILGEGLGVSDGILGVWWVG